MLNKEAIEQIIAPKLSEKNYQLIDLRVSASNSIMVEIDSDLGVTINDCVEFSRLIEGSLDRESEDFDLQVASPGLSEPFKIVWQYKKNIGNEIDALLNNGKKISGVLTIANDASFSIKETKSERVEGKKKKQLVEYNHTFTYDEVKSVKIKLSFK